MIRTQIVRIGNSQGIRIPKALLQQSGIGTDIILEVDGDRIVLAPTKAVRSGWDDAFKRMADKGDDTLIDDFQPTSWDSEEWEW